ncbi:hypothetical protein LXL04_003213 [Taraxacum kok-saghyz]
MAGYLVPETSRWFEKKRRKKKKLIPRARRRYAKDWNVWNSQGEKGEDTVIVEENKEEKETPITFKNCHANIDMLWCSVEEETQRYGGGGGLQPSLEKERGWRRNQMHNLSRFTNKKEKSKAKDNRGQSFPPKFRNPNLHSTTEGCEPLSHLTTPVTSIPITEVGMKNSEGPKTSKGEDGVDFISNMPDAILVLILSRLSSTEEQIRSSILSRRWRYLWTAVPTVDMQFLSGEESKQSKFKEFMYWVLASKTVNLDSFRLSFYYWDSIATVWRWVHLAVMRNVKQIDLRIGYEEKREAIELPHYLVSCGSLEVLRLNLRNYGLSLPRSVGFPALRVLHLTNVCLPEDDLVNNFLKNCPLLEDLSLVGCELQGLVCISCPKLKRLSIVNWSYYMGCHGIKISCPKLVDLDLGGCLWEEDDPDPLQYPGNSHFKWGHIYFFWESIDAAACNLPLPNLKNLVLRTTMEAFTVNELTRVLKCCPKVENLTLIITKVFGDEYEWVDEAETRRIWYDDVKTVEFFEFNGEKPKLDIKWCENDLELFLTFSWEKKSRASIVKVAREKVKETGADREFMTQLHDEIVEQLMQIMKKSERPKASKREDGVDLISKMPDAILLLILSRLSSTGEQIRSTILSRRWRYLWTAVPSVDMQFLSEEESKQSQFKEFVYWVLASKTVDLDSFCLRLNNDYIMSTIWRWVHLAVMRNDKQLELSFRIKEEPEAIDLPLYLMNCGSLEVLDLTDVDLPEDDDLVNDFLKRFPLLEDLSLVGCLLGKLVCILYPKLKKLRIISWDDVGCHSIKICCPKLVYMELGGRIMYGTRDSVVFLGNYHFKCAHLYFSFQSIDGACDVALPNLKTMLLRTTMEAFTVDELIQLLKYCPKLENLTLIIRKALDEEYEWVDAAETRQIWTRDVESVELFEFNGQKPKLVIDWFENEVYMFFTWGNKANW